MPGRLSWRHSGPAQSRLSALPLCPAQADPAIRASRQARAPVRGIPGRGFPIDSQLCIDVVRVRPTSWAPACLRDLPPKE
ncbi:hypothetical protein AQY21_17275 [Paracoccus sp. MKU1]|nr:hypothetical protein AQY21_17275 [Paracoccus sp. MKU1]